MDAAKRILSKLFWKDAFEKLLSHIDKHVSPQDRETWSEYRRVWFNVLQLQREAPRVTKETIDSSAPYEVDESSSKDLDYDSIYVQAQRKDLSDEDKWNILLHTLTLQEFEKDRKQSE
jgi:hypothetical protein